MAVVMGAEPPIGKNPVLAKTDCARLLLGPSDERLAASRTKLLIFTAKLPEGNTVRVGTTKVPTSRRRRLDTYGWTAPPVVAAPKPQNPKTPS